MCDRAIWSLAAMIAVIIVGAPAVAAIAKCTRAAWFVLVMGSAALLALAMMLARRVPGEVPAFARV